MDHQGGWRSLTLRSPGDKLHQGVGQAGFLGGVPSVGHHHLLGPALQGSLDRGPLLGGEGGLQVQEGRSGSQENDTDRSRRASSVLARARRSWRAASRYRVHGRSLGALPAQYPSVSGVANLVKGRSWSQDSRPPA
jgi:hypothetical protein